MMHFRYRSTHSRRHIQRLTALFLLCAIALLAIPSVASAEDPLRILGPEPALLSDQFPDGGLPLLPGAQNFAVFRASRYAAETTDGKGWTYDHHVDICCWAGWLYVAWDNGQKDEDTWPAREVYSTSTDGLSWTFPAELFPLGSSNPLRMYFYHAKNGRMVAIAARRVTHAKMSDATQGGVIVRELMHDHSLGPVFALIKTPAADGRFADFTTATDAGFVECCRELLADLTFLEQQDRGPLLGNDRMAPYASAPSDFGKAFCFFRRPDGTLVGICKKGYVVTSRDNGLSWAGPTRLVQFKAGTAKEWIQQTADGRYLWAHDPFPENRFPLVVMTGDDGVNFSNTRVVHGEVPRQRYEGLDKNIGPQYFRGISFWNSDGSRSDQAVWLAYSVNKEDVWVSRVPLPVRAVGDATVDDRFNDFSVGRLVPGWNTYVPKWSDVSIAPALDGNVLRLENHDPYDYALAQRVFSPRNQIKAQFEWKPGGSGKGNLQVELWTEYGDQRPVRLVLQPDGVLAGGRFIGADHRGEWTKVSVTVDAAEGSYSVAVDDQPPAVVKLRRMVGPIDRIVFRTGDYRSLPVRGNEVPIGSDRPVASSEFWIRYLLIGAFQFSENPHPNPPPEYQGRG